MIHTSVDIANILLSCALFQCVENKRYILLARRPVDECRADGGFSGEEGGRQQDPSISIILLLFTSKQRRRRTGSRRLAYPDSFLNPCYGSGGICYLDD